MKTLSIQKFSILVITIIVAFLAVIFYDFYLKERQITEKLIKTNLQSAALNLNQFLRKNFQPGQIGNIASQLDSRLVSNKTISFIQIIDEHNKTLYATPLYTGKNYIDKKSCLPITKIMQSSLEKVSCYEINLQYYNKLQAHTYHVLIGLNSQYISQLLTQEAKHLMGITLLFSLILFVFLYIFLKKYIILPLENLRTYAYYSEYSPQNFLIKEFESIRYSLEMTFRRLKTEQKNLYKLSTQDPLTGLYNRNDLTSQVERIITSSKRNNKKFAILFLDLDNFKNINDSIGHHFGDIILKKVATVLRLAIRENDIPARIGGDEFIIVLPDIEDERNIVDVIKRIKEQIATPILINNESYSVTMSMGVSLYPKDGKDFNTLLKHADIAMYKAKELGKNNYQFFTDRLNKNVQRKIKMHSILSEALTYGRFELFYQPKVDITTNKIVACEALIRLIDPHEGIISPDKFIPLAEESGMIIPIGEWIVQAACKQIAAWKNTPLETMQLSINVSGVQLADKNFMKILQENSACVENSKLDIELTESVLIQNFDEKIALLHEIKALGITLSLDDFGTGYSSLSYLRKIPFDTLKIDKSFIDSMQENKIFINMIIGIAKDLNLKVVAEGVETQEQLDYLKNMQCEMFQGYLCSKPLPSKEFETLFKDYNKRS